ncbi:MAG: MopE-related protein [Pseudomonadota bacterium]
MRSLPLLFALLLVACGEKQDTAQPGPVDDDADGYTSDVDCDDDDPGVHPDAEETCNGVDDNCDGTVDEGVGTTFYLDSDGDGHGNPAATTEACTRPDGWAAIGDDCDDDEPSVHTGANEVCNGVDDDCDGEIDDSPVDIRTWYADGDDDGYGDESRSVAACTQPVDWVGLGGDCDDDEAAVNPAATEICNGVDDDCDGAADGPDSADAATWYEDADADGYGEAGTAVVACDAPTGFCATDDDCDDSEATVHPGADEYCDGQDNDCDGTVDEDGAVDALDYYIDADADGFGDPATGTTTCTQPSGAVQDASDCDDGDAGVNPAATERCDGIDNDCSGTIDDTYAADALTWYADADADGYGEAVTSTLSCTQPTGFVADASDCDDTDPAIHPAADEVCSDAVDDDCDGVADDGCPAEHCGTISADETWATGAHLVTCDVYVHGTAAPVLTIEDGAEIAFAAGAGIIVGNGGHGALDVQGTAGLGVTFTSAQASPAPGDWDGLQFSTYDDGSVLEYATIAYGGGNGYGGVYATRASPTLTGCTIRDNDHAGVMVSNGAPAISGGTIQDNLGYGVDAGSGGLADGFADVVVTGNDDAPVFLDAAYAGALESSSTFTGNGDDRVILVGGDVDADATWQHLDVIWSVTGDIRVYGTAAPTLTIEDGAELEFASGTGITIGTSNHGRLLVEGGTSGVLMTATTGVAGGWDGLHLGYYDDGSVLEGLLLEYGGGNGYGNIYAYGADPTLTDCVIASSSHHGFSGVSGSFPLISDTIVMDNAEYGVALDSTSGLSTVGEPSFAGNTLTGNAQYPLTLPGNYVGQIASDSSFFGNGTDYVHVQGDTLDMDATWRLLDVPYQVGANLLVVATSGPTLTVEDGVELYFDSGAGMLVGTSNHGGLMVQGSSAGVLMTSSSASPALGSWSGLTLGYYTDVAAIDGLTLTYGGANGFGGIRMYNTTAELTNCVLDHNSNGGLYLTNGTVAISESSLSDNDGYGLELTASGFLASSSTAYPSGPTFQNNVVTGNTSTPLLLGAESLGQLDATSTFTGNGTDRLAVLPSTVTTSATWQKLDVDYRITGTINIADSSNPAVYIEPGVALRFSTGALNVGTANTGYLWAGGTTAEPVIFTSEAASPAPGDWSGITFGRYSGASGLEHAVVSYGGANGMANVYFSASSGSVLDSFISDSSHWGIYRSTSAYPTLSGVTYSGNTDGDLY